MATADDEDDLKLVKASAGLLADLQHDLPRLLRRKTGQVHTQIRQADLDRVIHLIEPFQNEPQLLDSSLRDIVPLLVDAYLEHLTAKKPLKSTRHLPFQDGVCILLYVLCKVRGYKVIVGFLSNEPRYLEPILEALESVAAADRPQHTAWQVSFVLLLWLSHLLLVPFDLDSISATPLVSAKPLKTDTLLRSDLPALISRVLRIGLAYLSTTTKTQDAASILLIRLIVRPDVQHLELGELLIRHHLAVLIDKDSTALSSIYERIGAMRLVAGVCASAELVHLIPEIYGACQSMMDDEAAFPIISNAVGKKLAVKTFRNIALVSLRSASLDGKLLEFLETTGVLENVVDFCLRCLSDKDTPVRQAAAKAISLVVQQLEPEMGHEIIQAVLDTFKEDMPRSSTKIDYATVDALRWHGLTFALAHVLFKRSASPDQLPEILRALFSALEFQQRTATGTSLGTNVRDAANFGIWSLARRYTTSELLSATLDSDGSIIQHLAVQLVLAACLDPAGNIRRGSSAALQELVGRHPDQVSNGIALVQVIDYQAVGLRKRAMIDVALATAALDPVYWKALLDGLLGWSGLGSADVLSRESAASSISQLWAVQPPEETINVADRVAQSVRDVSSNDAEALHGHLLTLANILRECTSGYGSRAIGSSAIGPHAIGPRAIDLRHIRDILTSTEAWSRESTPRMLKAEFSVAAAQFVRSVCEYAVHLPSAELDQLPIPAIDTITDQLGTRRDDPTLSQLPELVRAESFLMTATGVRLASLDIETLANHVSIDSKTASLRGAGRAIMLGALAPRFADDAPVQVLCSLVNAPQIEWRVTGLHSIRNVIGYGSSDHITSAIICGMRDHTIDERGDIGSLVRIAAIDCVRLMFERGLHSPSLVGELRRLSLDKLDRVRLQAGRCLNDHVKMDLPIVDASSVSSPAYFEQVLLPLLDMDADHHILESCLAGAISCAGLSAEQILITSRQVVATYFTRVPTAHLELVMTCYANVMKALVSENAKNVQAALDLLAFFLETNLLDRLYTTDFKWRNLLSTAQKAHYKSNDIPKIVAAVKVYAGLARVECIRKDVLKKLVGMCTIPYPRVRFAVAEAIWVATSDSDIMQHDPTLPPAKSQVLLQKLRERYV